MARVYALLLCAAVWTAGVAVIGAQGPGSQRLPPSSSPTFSRDVLPILQKNCQSCHRPGQIGPMPLLTYEQARPWARAIKTQVVSRAMPPWHADPRYGHFLNDRSLDQSAIDTLAAWADGGAPQGDVRQAPAPIPWPADGWQVQPDVVVTMPAYAVPSSGVVEWENIAIPSPFAEDTWVTSVEILPSAPATVHHMCFVFQPPRPDVVLNRYEWAEIARDAQGRPVGRQGPPAAAAATPPASGNGAPANRDAWILTRDVGSTEVKRRLGRPTITAGGTNCYVPGYSLHDYREYDAGVLVKGGQNMIVNLHYQTVGKPVTNTFKIGFTVAKAKPAKKFVALAPSGATRAFAIPPNEANYTSPPVELTINKAARLVWMSPHMHFRGKDMTWSVTYPDGRREVVLSVPRYQYAWQLQYHTDVPLPPGTRMRVDAHYDNSAANKANPDPNTWVYPGNQAWEEMMNPFTWLLVDVDVDERGLTSPFLQADGA